MTPVGIKQEKPEKGFRSVAAEHDLDVDSIGNADPHKLPKSTLIRVKVDEPLVDAHLPPVVGLAAFSVGRFPAGDPQLFGRKGNGTADCNAGPFGDGFDLSADLIDHLGVGATERDSSTL